MTFLDAIEAGLSFEDALSAGGCNKVTDLTKEIAEMLLGKNLSIGQIAKGFDVREEFVAQKLKEFRLYGLVADTINTKKRKMP